MPNGIPFLVKFREIKDKIELKIFVDDEPVWTGENPTKIRDYNYTWVHGLWCPECSRTELKLQSFVRGLRDPQRMYNRKINQAMDIIESQIQGLKILRSKYLMNPEDAYKSGQGIVLHTNDDAPNEMSLTEIFKQMPASEVPQSVFTMLSIIDKDETESGGLNQEIFGTDDKNVEVSGVLHAYRTGKALTGQAWMFQNLRESKRDFGIKQVKMVQLNYSPQRVRKIINEEPVPGFYSEDVTRFDCSPTEGLLTDSQQNMYYQELKSLLKDFPQMFTGIITPEMLVKASPMQFKTPTLQAIQAAAQQRQQLTQAQIQSQQLTDRLTQSLTAAQIGQAHESIADTMEKRAQAGLNRAKAAVEIQKIESEPVQKLLDAAIKLETAQLKAKSVREKQEQK